MARDRKREQFLYRLECLQKRADNDRLTPKNIKEMDRILAELSK